jgi:hypothetical protein
MTTKKGDVALESTNTKIEVATPALHNGRYGIPAIFTIGSKRFASSAPTDPQDAQEINNTLAALGGK